MSEEHVKINGVWYRLAEGGEGTHYSMNLEPLRLPNAQVVQGKSGTMATHAVMARRRELRKQLDSAMGDVQVTFDRD